MAWTETSSMQIIPASPQSTKLWRCLEILRQFLLDVRAVSAKKKVTK